MYRLSRRFFGDYDKLNPLVSHKFSGSVPSQTNSFKIREIRFSQMFTYVSDEAPYFHTAVIFAAGICLAEHS
jgi:hypothetical protein